MLEIVTRPLTAAAFAPYGDVVEAPSNPGRAYFESSLGNLRAGASPKLWMLTKHPISPLPIRIETLERHEFSSQTFVPIDIGKWLVVVAPQAESGGPAVERAEAFLASPEQGVSYRPNTWHSGLNVFDRVARLVVFMWLDGTPQDEEAVAVPPFMVREGQV
jgi:ureidoglycolate lyase